MLDRIAEQTGFFIAEKRVKHLPYPEKSETVKRYHIRKSRKRHGIYGDLPAGAS